MQMVGIYTNVEKDLDLAITKRVIAALQERNIAFCLDDEVAAVFGPCTLCKDNPVEMLIVLGGDGTMLAAARKYASTGALLFGLNLGRLGFLLDADLATFEETLDEIIAGEYEVQERIMLQAEIVDANGHSVYRYCGLNDAVISQRNMRVIELKAYVNKDLAYHVRCDGVIISTPSGSTAYSLSAGGPVISPNVEALLITPLCAHSLQSVNYVVSGDAKIEIEVLEESGAAALSLDGQDYVEIEKGSIIRIVKTPYKAKFIRTRKKSFFTILQEKLAEWR